MRSMVYLIVSACALFFGFVCGLLLLSLLKKSRKTWSDLALSFASLFTLLAGTGIGIANFINFIASMIV